MKLFSSCFALCKAAKERVSFSISSLAAVILLLIFHMNPLLDFFCVWSIVFLKIVRFLTLCLFPVFKHFIIQLALCFKNFNHGI